MKRCPSCNTQYTDITLLYCLQDGTPLVDGPQAETPTVVLNETETVAARRGHDRMQVPISDPASVAWQQSQVTHVAPLQPQTKGSNTAIAVAVTVVLMLVVFGALGIGAWLFFGNGQGEVAKNTANWSNISNQNPSPNTSSFSTPQISSSATPARTPGTTPSANSDIPLPTSVDDQQTRGEIVQRINSWKSQAESLNLNSYMAHYAPTVDYYNKSGASSSFVRADKARAFSRYSSIGVNISNMTVTTDPSGQSASAVFDKEWDFRGNGNSSGKVRQLMRFRKFNGQWLISAEKDLKLYYKR